MPIISQLWSVFRVLIRTLLGTLSTTAYRLASVLWKAVPTERLPLRTSYFLFVVSSCAKRIFLFLVLKRETLLADIGSLDRLSAEVEKRQKGGTNERKTVGKISRQRSRKRKRPSNNGLMLWGRHRRRQNYEKQICSIPSLFPRTNGQYEAGSGKPAAKQNIE